MELVLNGGEWVSLDGFKQPLSQAKLRSVQDSWQPELHTAAANTARRLWSEAKQEFVNAMDGKFTSMVPDGPLETGVEPAWAAAVSLVLPLELHDVLADSRYAEPPSGARSTRSRCT